MTPITYKEAAGRLGVGQSTIRNAVHNGVLARFPMAGQVQHVIMEQVDLFKNKSQLRVNLLTAEEHKSWAKMTEEVNRPWASETTLEKKDEQHKPVIDPFGQALKELMKQAYKEMLQETQQGERGPQEAPFSQPPVPAGR